MRRAQQPTPTLVFKSHWRTHEQSRRKPAKRSRPETADRAETSSLEGCEAFSTWVRKHLPANSSLASLCDQLGREGSRGSLARRLLTAELAQRQLPVNVAMDLRNSRHTHGGYNPEMLYSLRGRALLLAFLDDAGDHGSRKSTVLFSWTGYSGVPSIQETLDRYLTDGPLLPDLWAVTQWLWKGAILISSSRFKDKGMVEIWQEIVLAVKHYGDWLPLTAIVVGYQEFLRRVLSFDDKRATKLILPQTQALTELVTTWIDDRHEWMPILWKELFRDMRQTILGVYHSMDCLCSDFDTVQTSMEVSRMLTACTTLLAVLEGIVCYANCAAKLVVALPSMAGILGLFSCIQLPLQYVLPNPIEQACHAIHRNFRQLGASFSANSLPLHDYLRSLVRFAADSSFAAAPSWCQHAATISHRYWKDENTGAVWVQTLLDHLTSCSSSTSTSTLNPIHQCLHENMVHLCLGSTSCTSLAPLLLESLTNYPLAAVEGVLCMTPPTRLFFGDTANLSLTLKLVLDTFDGPSVAWLLLGMALCLDALSSETRPIASYHAQRDSCLGLASRPDRSLVIAPAISRTRITEPGVQATDERDDDLAANDDDDDEVQPMVDTEPPFSPNDDYDEDDDCILLLELQ
jgi:hypothetical protein